MDSAVLLDLLGNENRRRILRLLSHKPCYVTEISEYLGVSPKAVIDHLGRLEDAGLIESRTDDQRRKYFHIVRNLRLKVSVSPYRFGAKSAYPASRSLDMRGRCQHISLELPGRSRGGTDDASPDTEAASEPNAVADTGRVGPVEPDRSGGGTDPDATAGSDASVARLARQYAYLEDVERELSLAQRWVHGRVTDVLDALSDRVGSEADSRFHAEVLAAIARGASEPDGIADDLNADLDRVETVLDLLSERGLIERDEQGWAVR